MRILAITNLYPRPGHPTLAPYNRQQFVALAAEHALAVVAPVAWTDEARDRRAGRWGSRRYRTAEGIEVRHPRYYFPPGMLRASYGGFLLRSIRAEVLKLVREFQPEILFGCWAHPDGWAAVRLGRETGLPVVVKVVGSDVLVITRDIRRQARVIEALRGAAAVVAVSQDLAAAVGRLGVPADRVSVVYNGVDQELFRPGDQREARVRLGLEPDKPLILFVGNLLASKGAGVLLEAVARLRARLADPPRCVLVGRGREERLIRATIARLGLADLVALAGPRPLDELPSWYQAADVVALPSFSEGIPNVLLEAAACGRPFVATRVGGIPEVARSTDSLLVTPGSPTELADAITTVLARPRTEGIPQPHRSDDSAVASTWTMSADRLAAVLAGAAGLPREARRHDLPFALPPMTCE